MVKRSLFGLSQIRGYGNLRFLVLLFIRIMLVLAIIIAIVYHRNLVLTMSIIGLVVSFIPFILRRFFKISFPLEVEIILLFFIYGILLFGDVRGFYSGFWWWNVILNFGAATILGLVGLMFFYVFESEDIIDASPLVIVFFTFCFAFSIGGLWEIFEYIIDFLIGSGLQSGGLNDTMSDLIFNAIGALFISIIGYFHIKSNKRSFFSFLISNMIKNNLKYFKSKKSVEYSSNLIEILIKKGESDSLEFKSTLRKNLHTNNLDKNIEHAVLKTIVGYLNSKGGTVLVGVCDSGKILGVENDDFESHDKLKVYLTAMIRNNIGAQFLSYINFELYSINDKHILKIDCTSSNKRVFLNWNSEEQFFVRHGSATIRLSGNDLIDYVNERFG